MNQSFELIAERRDGQGKGASRRLRREGKVPGIIYGGDKPPIPISFEARILNKQLENEAFFAHILKVRIAGEDQEEQVVLRDLQRHPYRAIVLHFDLQRIVANEVLDMTISLHFLNEETAPGVKAGGMVIRHLTDIVIRCLPKDLPEAISIDLGQMQIGDTIHLSGLKMPGGVELIDFDPEDEESDQPVVSIIEQHGHVNEEAAGEGESEGADGEGAE